MESVACQSVQVERFAAAVHLVIVRNQAFEPKCPGLAPIVRVKYIRLVIAVEEVNPAVEHLDLVDAVRFSVDCFGYGERFGRDELPTSAGICGFEKPCGMADVAASDKYVPMCLIDKIEIADEIVGLVFLREIVQERRRVAAIEVNLWRPAMMCVLPST
jgi:hypothetical protein